ncbi:MAG TPA: HisA/HisF-related TIM barrel protein [Holophagaceae bacterium]|nr:HisA/HisF-related TIM barrel protein [Holophagaceae bacterium]
MKIFPTLNIQQGRVIPTFGDPAPSALVAMEILDRLLESGCSHLALVDVDAAQNKGNNRELIGQLLRHVQIRSSRPCVQVAGGIRSSDQCSFFLDHGANWLVVGTLLQKSSLVVEQLVGRFQSHLTAGIDARGGQVHCSGWAQGSDQATGISARDMALRAKALGFKRLHFVDLAAQAGAQPDFETARTIQEAAKLPLLMGGTLTSRAHLEAARATRILHGGLVDALLVLGDSELLGLLQPACA